MHIIDISWWRLAIGFLALVIPAWILIYYRTRLFSKLLISTIRMTLQLLFVGYYLEYLFRLNNPWLNLGWMTIMIIVSDIATIDRSEMKLKSLFLPVFFATLLGIVIIDFFFLGVVIRLQDITTAQYLIPITGMILGNCLRSNVIGIHAFYYSLNRNRSMYHYYLASGATRSEALFPFFTDAFKQVANPTLATMATIGLVSLPGMMTGQILSGSSPLTAIRYQIMIMLAIFSGTILTVFLAIKFMNPRVFDKADRFRDEYLKD